MDPTVVTTAAEGSAAVCAEELQVLGLQTAQEKSENFLMDPNLGEEAIFRRVSQEEGERRSGNTENPRAQ